MLSFVLPCCEGVDAFSVDWGGVINYLVPPVFKLVATRAAGASLSCLRGYYSKRASCQFCSFYTTISIRCLAKLKWS